MMVIIFTDGTCRNNEGRLGTAGCRVLNVTGLGPTVAVAAQASRDGAERIAFEGKTWRRDIAWREIRRAGATRRRDDRPRDRTPSGGVALAGDPPDFP